MQQATVIVNKQAIKDLTRLKEEFDAVVESLELSSNKEFIKSYRRAKKQVEKRQFADWDAL